MTDLDARYGRRPRAVRTTAIWLCAAGLVVAALVWFVWAKPLGTGPQPVWRDTGYTILEPTSRIAAQWELTVEPGTPVSCAIYAMNAAFAVVGWRVIEIPPSQQRIRQFDESIRTTEPPVTGLVYRCWLS